MFTLLVPVMLPASGAFARTGVTVEHVPPVLASPAFVFETVPPPARDDCAATARLAVANGRLDADGGAPAGHPHPAGWSRDCVTTSAGFSTSPRVGDP